MAARRLLIVMLILLGLSTLAAALIPPDSLREETTTGTTTTPTTTTNTETTPPATVPRGNLFRSRISVGGNTVPLISCPARAKRVRPCRPIQVGDQLSLVVWSRKVDQLEVPAFGLVDAVGPAEPALFDLLFREPGTYRIRFVSTKRVAARIEVKPRKAKKKAKSRARAGSGRP